MRFTIRQLAKAAGVPISTVRYYDRIGLVSPSERRPSGYRVYRLPDLNRLRYIRAALAAGFTHNDLDVLRSGDCPSVQRIMEARLDEVKAKLVELGAKAERLNSLIELCAKSDGQRCPVPLAIHSVRS